MPCWFWRGKGRQIWAICGTMPTPNRLISARRLQPPKWALRWQPMGIRYVRTRCSAGPGSCCCATAISGSGVFRDEGTDERARQLFFDGLTPDFQIIIPDFGVVEGPFQVSGLEYAGSLNGEATFEVSLMSAGELTFSPDEVVV